MVAISSSLYRTSSPALESAWSKSYFGAACCCNWILLIDKNLLVSCCNLKTLQNLNERFTILNIFLFVSFKFNVFSIQALTMNWSNYFLKLMRKRSFIENQEIREKLVLLVGPLKYISHWCMKSTWHYQSIFYNEITDGFSRYQKYSCGDNSYNLLILPIILYANDMKSHVWNFKQFCNKKGFLKVEIKMISLLKSFSKLNYRNFLCNDHSR